MSAPQNPLVSVVIATYNMGQHLPGAVQSVLAQQYGNVELIVVDDGSTDGTPDVMTPFLADPRVRYFRQKNAGQASAKNAGIRHSTGTLIGFCDADDAWLPEKLALQVPLFLRDEKIGVVYSGVQDMAQANAKARPPAKVPTIRGRVTDELYLNNFVPFGTAVVRRDCLERVGPFDERYRMGIDWELWLRCSLHYEFDYVPEVTYLYRVWEGQMSNNWRGRYDFAFRIMRDFIQRYPAAVSGKTLRQAMALTYASRGRARSYLEGEHLQAFADACRSVLSNIGYPPGWYLFGRVMLNALGKRAP